MATGQSTYSIQGSFNVGNITAGFQKIQSLASQTSQRVVSSINAQNKAFAGQHSQMARYGHAFTRFYGSEGMFRAGDIMRRNLESLKDYAEEAQKLAQAQFKFRVIGLDESENQRAFGAVQKTVQNLKGMRLDEVTETITDLHTATGSLTHALEGLVIASKFRFGFQTLMGDKFSPTQIEGMIQKGFKAMELMGVMQMGQVAIDERFNAMAKMMSATGGRVTPDMLLLMAQRGQTSLRSLSTEGMMKMAAPLQELGGSRAGTAMMSLYQMLVGGVGGGQESIKEFLRLGLADPKKVKMSAKGLPTHVMPGGYGAIGQALQEDPLKAADMLVKAMAHPKKGKPIEGAQALVEAMQTGATLTPEQLRPVRLALANMFHNRMAQGFMDIFVTQRAQVMKEFKLAERAKNIQEVYDAALDTPMGKMREFEAAVGNLKMTIGGPLLTAISQAAKVLIPFVNAIAKAPPWLTLTALGLGKVALAAFQMRMAFAMSGIGGIGGAAAPAATSSGAAAFNALFTGTSAAAQTTRWYQAALVRNIAAFGTLAIAVAAAALIMNEYNKEQEAQEGAEDSKKKEAAAVARLYSHASYAQARDVTEKRLSLNEILSERRGEFKWGGPMSPLTWQRESMQEMLSRVPKGIYGGPGGKERTDADRREAIAGLTEQLKGLPILKMPSQFAMMMERVQGSRLPEEQKSALTEALKAAQPKAYKEWEEAFNAAGRDFKAATDAMIKEDVDAAHTLGQGLNRAAEAAETFADRTEKAWNQKFGFGEGGPTPQPQAYHGAYNAPKMQGAAYRGGAGHTFNVALKVVEGAPDNEAAAKAAADQFYREVKQRLDDRHRQREVMA